jgi:NAD(P)-dependent dehydrogenase (short-subunit alcohol dehydrogenase family)
MLKPWQLDLSAKEILVTGAASGIGEACARAVTALGARVTLLDKNLEGLSVLEGQLPGSRSSAIDISDEEAVVAFAQNTPPFDGLIHCAGVLQRPLPPEKLSMREWDIVNRVDLRGTYVLVSNIGGTMATRGSGSIVAIASVAGMRSGPLHAYGPAKAGVIALMETLAAEWGPSGVRVNAVSPGFTTTSALEKGIDSGVMNPTAMEQSTAMGRLLRAEEIAAAAVFLTSDLASGITGINLPVDAGYLVATPWSAYGGLRPEPSGI